MTSTNETLALAIFNKAFPLMSAAARRHGYALSKHGSMARDFDIIAVPWLDQVSDQDTVADAIKDACGGSWRCVHGLKPLGRLACSIDLPGVEANHKNWGYVDLSVVSPYSPMIYHDTWDLPYMMNAYGQREYIPTKCIPGEPNQ